MSGTKEGDGLYDSLANELSYDQIQQMMDQLLGEESFGFADMVQSMIRNGKADTVVDLLHSFRKIVLSSFSSDRKMFVSLIAVALVGAVFFKLRQGASRQGGWQGPHLYCISVIFFNPGNFVSADCAACGQTMENLLAFVKVLIPAFFISLSFTQGGVAAGAYYEFALAMIMVVNGLLAGLALPAVHLYFFLQVVNQLSGEDMFSKMADLIRDGVRFGVKAVFGLMMGMNVIQGLDHSGECRGQKHDDGAVVKLDTGCRQFGGECFADRFVCR